MPAILTQTEAPKHLFLIPELDFSEDLFADTVSTAWFRLGAWTVRPHPENGVEDAVLRESLLLTPGGFAQAFEKLGPVGNVLHRMGRPGGSVSYGGDDKVYTYGPFHRFELPATSLVAEPLVFVRNVSHGTELVINPDLWLFLQLEETSPRSGVWWDPRRGVDALLHHRINGGTTLDVVEIRTAHLLKYLQARQLALVIAHYRHKHLLNPSPDQVAAFVKEDVQLASQSRDAKAIIDNWGLRDDILGASPFLQRRIHLWFEVPPPKINLEDPWSDPAPFDLQTFTLPTRSGPVAPARWAHLRETKGRSFEGVACDFMDFVYFRQEVLAKYEGASGFDVGDNGSVSHYPYWGLVRSTMRIGNELLGTAIGDFAEEVPFQEWPHWKQYAAEPPSPETAATLLQEQSVPDAVNSLVKELRLLNHSFAAMGNSLGVANLDPLWDGSLDSLAGRWLKWVYPATADDDEFLKRATLISTLVIEALKPAPLRRLLCEIAGDLHQDLANPPKSLGSRNLLQRLTLVATLISDLQPDVAEVPVLVRQAEVREDKQGQTDLQDELDRICGLVRREFAPVAFLYDLRTHGGLAHAPNKEKASAAAVKLGLPEKSWHRSDYVRLVNLVAQSIHQVSSHLQVAARTAQVAGSQGSSGIA